MQIMHPQVNIIQPLQPLKVWTKVHSWPQTIIMAAWVTEVICNIKGPKSQTLMWARWPNSNSDHKLQRESPKVQDLLLRVPWHVKNSFKWPIKSRLTIRNLMSINRRQSWHKRCWRAVVRHRGVGMLNFIKSFNSNWVRARCSLRNSWRL
jgi:hypothetical protein